MILVLKLWLLFLSKLLAASVNQANGIPGKSVYFLLPSLGVVVLTDLVQSQDLSGFINIDCGLPTNATYTDTRTSLDYVSDTAFVETGISRGIAAEYTTYDINQQLQNVRSFPEGDRNCYRIELKKSSKYLIRATFLYGNYDGQHKAPEFDLHLGTSKWDTVEMINSTTIMTKEIIHFTTMNYLYVCLVNSGSGIPFISTLELRPLKNSSYNTDSGSLVHFVRFDVGSTTNKTVRYPDDVYDRVWSPYNFFQWEEINTNQTIDLQQQNSFRPPSVVMSTANAPANANDSMLLSINMEETSPNFFVYMHFAEIVKLQTNQVREFNISLNGELWYGPVVPDYLYTTTIFSPYVLSAGKYQFSIYKTERSTLLPLLNAIEIYYLLQLSQSESNQEDGNVLAKFCIFLSGFSVIFYCYYSVDAIMNIKSTYGIKRNWQGDPCLPQAYLWVGLNCSYNDSDMPRITSLNLSSSGLTGEIPTSLSNLKLLQSLDLSNNDLTGSVPDFLSQLSSLKVLILTGNTITGSVPSSLIEKSKKNLLVLSIGGNPNLCALTSCEKKKNKVVVPLVATVAGMVVLLGALVTLCCSLKRRKRKAGEQQGKTENKYEALESKSKGRHFTYSEVLKITNNFEKVLGKGGFGTVYHGYLDKTEVAVKMLSPSSVQGCKQFQAEVKTLLRVHHRNLTTLVGFCNEDTYMGLIYEYMANGDLETLLSGSNRNTLKWDMGLLTVLEAAKGLEYLHSGSRATIVYRDVKTANILLNEKFQAKLADFGLSRSFPVEGGTHVSTVVAGTPGYLDPEYSVTNRLTEKSDVYSFGIVLLRVITGRPVITIGEERSVHIVQWVSHLLGNGDIKNIVDPILGEDFDINSVWKIVEIAMACTSLTSAGRPTMHQVVTELNECLAAQSNGTGNEPNISMEIVTGSTPLAR